MLNIGIQFFGGRGAGGSGGARGGGRAGGGGGAASSSEQKAVAAQEEAKRREEAKKAAEKEFRSSSGSVRSERITASSVSAARAELAEAAALGMKIEVTQSYFGKTETTTYTYGTKYPNGLRGRSVTAWYASDWKQSYNYKSTQEFANYISNVNSGRGGRNIRYEVRKKKG